MESDVYELKKGERGGADYNSVKNKLKAEITQPFKQSISGRNLDIWKRGIFSEGNTQWTIILPNTPLSEGEGFIVF